MLNDTLLYKYGYMIKEFKKDTHDIKFSSMFKHSMYGEFLNLLDLVTIV